MILSPGARKFALTAHVIASVGWLGSVGAFLALAVTGLSSGESFAVRASYAAMEPVTWYIIVPLSFASLLTGLVQALGTPWGLIRHYWVVAKLLLTLLATLLLLVHTQPIGFVAATARAGEMAPSDLRGLRIQLVFDAGAALLVLLMATVLSVYKPRGLTRYGWRRQREERAAAVVP